MVSEISMQAIVAAGILAAIFLAVNLVRLKPIAGFIGIGVFSVVAWDVPNLPAVSNIFGLNLYPADALAIVLLLAAACYGTPRENRAPKAKIALAAIFALALLSVVLGIMEHGVSAPLNEARLFLWLSCACWWSVSLDWGDRRVREAAQRAVLFIGWTLVAAAVLHGALYGIGSASDSRVLPDGTVTTSRILVSGQSMVLLLSAYASVCVLWRTRSTIYGISATVFLAVSFISQNRSVWLAGGISILILILAVRMPYRLRMLGYAQIAGIAVILISLPGFLRPYYGKIFESLDDSRTYASRETGWTQLIDQQVAMGPLATLLGQPFGSGFRRMDTNGIYVDFTPHNWYVLLFLRIGILGLLGMAVCLSVTVWRLINARNSAFQLCMLAGLMSYAWTYSIDWYLAPFVGWVVYTAFSSANSHVKLQDHAIDDQCTRGGTGWTGQSNSNKVQQVESCES
ncbi:O-antigen ligase family protein [Rhodococcus opacus]|uniref:O-antigen ligase family protein n=1 Tax=Rhodococcus opacus TaxID=37919 RepID=UPI0029495660|nr:hypothetical protein [Rhodococcus opacus]MDV6241228.1 hypothetical protein [Rhodococcus opacus]